MSEETVTLLQHLAIASANCYVASHEPAWANEDKTSQVFVFEATENTPLIYALPGTEEFADWLVNCDIFPMEARDHVRFGPVHRGFYEAALPASEFILHDLHKRNWPPFALAGHSKGGAVTGLVAALLCYNGLHAEMVGLFEPPRFATGVLADFLSCLNIQRTRTRNASGPDLITFLPLLVGFTDIGNEMMLTVPDDADAEAKHKIPCVLAALGCEPIEGD